jgi:hypothetical protein
LLAARETGIAMRPDGVLRGDPVVAREAHVRGA